MSTAIRWSGPVLLLSWLLLAAPARADSWLPPQGRRVGAPDGRTYLVLAPTTGTDASWRLVRRGGKRPLVEGEARVEAGDVVTASGTCTMPMEAFCLSGGEGFVLFETYGAIGYRAAATRYDAHGRRLWERKLSDLFSAAELRGFRNTAGSTWWYETVWLDGDAGDLVVVYETPLDIAPTDPVHGPNSGPPRTPGVLRLRLADGTHRRAEITDLLQGLAAGPTERRVRVLDAVGRARPAGWESAAGALLADAEAPRVLRVKAGVELRRAGDARGRDLVVAAARAKEPADARALALRNLRLFLGKDALPVLRAALKDEQRETGLAAYVALQDFGADALDTLIEMLLEKDAPASYRRAAIGVLSQLGAAAAPALPALEKVAATAPAELADEARYALEALRKAR